MKMVLSFLCVVFFAVLPNVSGAQEGKYQEVTQYNFTDEVLVGDIEIPAGENVLVRPGGHNKSLIRVRTHFIVELLKSLETI